MILSFFYAYKLLAGMGGFCFKITVKSEDRYVQIPRSRDDSPFTIHHPPLFPPDRNLVDRLMYKGFEKLIFAI